jgi:hypothetical protein
MNECNGGTARNIATVSSSIVISPPSSFILIASSSSWQNPTCNVQHTTHNTQHTTDCDQSAVPFNRPTPCHAVPCHAQSRLCARKHARTSVHTRTHARTHARTHDNRIKRHYTRPCIRTIARMHGLRYTFLPPTLRSPTHPLPSVRFPPPD